MIPKEGQAPCSLRDNLPLRHLIKDPHQEPLSLKDLGQGWGPLSMLVSDHFLVHDGRPGPPLEPHDPRSGPGVPTSLW